MADTSEVEPPDRELTLSDIHQSITGSSGILNAKLDSLTREFSAITTKLTDLENSVTMNYDKLAEIEQKKLPDIERKMADEISKLQDKLTLMEIYGRRTNLLFYGVIEPQNEVVVHTLRDTFIYLGIHADNAANIAIVNAHRLPRRDNIPPNQASGPPAPRAIIAKFVYMEDRNQILAAFDERRRPRDSGAAGPEPDRQARRITVRTDLPPALKARRSILANTAYTLRKEKNVSPKISGSGTKVLLHWKEKGTANWNLHRD